MSVGNAVRVGMAGSFVLLAILATILFPWAKAGPAGYLLLGAAIAAFVSYVVQGAIIGPALRAFDEPRVSDWINSPHQISRLLEYRRLCLEHDHPLFWYKVQVGLFFVSLGFVVLAMAVVALA